MVVSDFVFSNPPFRVGEEGTFPSIQISNCSKFEFGTFRPTAPAGMVPTERPTPPHETAMISRGSSPRTRRKEDAMATITPTIPPGLDEDLGAFGIIVKYQDGDERKQVYLGPSGGSASIRLIPYIVIEDTEALYHGGDPRTHTTVIPLDAVVAIEVEGQPCCPEHDDFPVAACWHRDPHSDKLVRFTPQQ